jgi:hypothetical protein
MAADRSVSAPHVAGDLQIWELKKVRANLVVGRQDSSDDE